MSSRSTREYKHQNFNLCCIGACTSVFETRWAWHLGAKTCRNFWNLCAVL